METLGLKPRRGQIRVPLIGVILIFLCGLGLGSSGAFSWMHYRASQAFREHDTKKMQEHFLEMIQKELALTEEQMPQVQKLFEEDFRQRQDFFKEFSPKMKAQDTWLQEEMTKLLTPEQQKKWKEQFDQIFRHPPGDGPHGPPPGNVPHGGPREGPGGSPLGDVPGHGPHGPPPLGM